jgi:raffinose/stachyose/melibiose transport system permease protein
MEKRKNIYILEIVAIVLFLLYMIPFALVLINSSKPSLAIITDPLAFPKNPSQLIANIHTVITSPNVRYPSSFVSSLIITVCSVGLLILISSMAAWVLVRTKTKLSNAILMVFFFFLLIPFQVVMFLFITCFHMVYV